LTLPPNVIGMERGCVQSTSRSTWKGSEASDIFQLAGFAKLLRLVPPGGTQPRSGAARDVPAWERRRLAGKRALATGGGTPGAPRIPALIPNGRCPKLPP